MSGEAANPGHEHDEQESALNWSVSGISAASGFDPDLYTLELSNSGCTTPEMKRKIPPLGKDEIDHLINSVRDLRTSLASISEKSVTPLSSPRPTANASSRSSAPSTPNTVQKRPQSTGQTPPSKDPGPDSSTHKLEHMRRVLKDLEDAKNQYKANRSKIPKRSLNFQSSSNASSTMSSAAKTQSINDQFKEMSEFLDKVKASKKKASSSNSSDDTTVIDSKVDDLQKQLDCEKSKNKELSSQHKTLAEHSKNQAEELSRLRENCAQKDKILLELKSCWSQVVSAMTSEREELMSQNVAAVDEINRMKCEQEEIKRQFFVCQEELERALELASDFKQKVDEDEKIKQDLLDQVLLERQQKLRESEMMKSLGTELVQSRDQLENLSKQLSQMDLKFKQVLEEKSNCEKTMAIERDRFASEKDRLKSELAERLKAKEEALHDFYGNQMESILSEKIGTLQDYVKDWEQKVAQEKVEAVSSLRAEHNKQIEALRRQFAQLEAQIKASEAIHIASKREAEALKGQLGYNPPREATSTDEDDEALNSRRSLPPVLLNNKGPHHRKGASSRMSSMTVTNDLKQYQHQEQRPRSAGAKFSVLRYESPERLHNDVTDDTDASLLTTKEKKDLVKAFIKQFLEDNPDAVLDSKLMSGLSEKANKLIDQSFHIEEELSSLTPVRDSSVTSVRRRMI